MSNRSIRRAQERKARKETLKAARQAASSLPPEQQPAPAPHRAIVRS